MTVTTLYIGAAIFAVLALIGAGWLLGHWANGYLRRMYRQAGVPWDDPEVPAWVSEGPRVCPRRPRRHAYRDRCTG